MLFVPLRDRPIPGGASLVESLGVASMRLGAWRVRYGMWKFVIGVFILIGWVGVVAMNLRYNVIHIEVLNVAIDDNYHYYNIDHTVSERKT